MIAIHNTTNTARRAFLALEKARSPEVREIGNALLTALTEQTGALVDRQAAIAERTTNGGKKKLKQSPATISTKVRKALKAASVALKATGTKLAKTVAKDIDTGLARSLELYNERQAFIANR